MNKNDRLHAQIRSLLTRWGYKPIVDNLDPWDKYRYSGTDLTLWLYPGEANIDGWRFDILLKEIGKAHKLEPIDVRRMIEAEPIDRDFGAIDRHPQPLEEWGDREDHADATLKMDARGRDRLIAALIEGKESIEVYGESGGGYCLRLDFGRE